MKKIIIAISIFLLPAVSFAAISAPWTATSTDQGYITPSKINGNNPWLTVSGVGTSTFSGPIRSTCFSINGTTCLSGTGTVTSVALTVPAFLSIGGSPITTSGTLAIGLSGLALPVANGGTASTTLGFTNGVFYSDGSSYTNTSLFRFDGTNLGIGTTTPGSLLSVGNTNGINLTAATSTWKTSGGLNITSGCYAFGGSCLTAGSIGGGSTEAVNWATTAVLSGTPTYANGASGVGATLTEVGTGALSVDSNSPVAGDRVLVKNQASAFQNGIYSVTATGSGIASYILTRSADYNTPTEITPGINTYVLSGTANTDTTWAVNYTPPLVIGTNNLVYTESAAGLGVSSIAQTYGTTQNGAITLATSTTAIANDWGITNTNGAFTFNLPTATASIRGLLSGTDWTTFNGKLSANQSITLSGAVTGTGSTAITTAFGTLAQGILGNPFAAATIPTALSTSTIFGDTATFLTTGNVGISSTTPGALFSIGNALTSGGYYFTTTGFGISSSTPNHPFSVLQGALTFIIKTTGAIIGYDAANGWNGRISPTRSFVLGSATTTTFTATSTGAYVPSLVMPFTGTLRTAQCQASTTASFIGTNVQINNTNVVPKYFVSSSTVGTETFTSSNTFSKGDKISVYFGTTTSDTNNIYENCTFNVTESP